jgi:hypothetical protein
LVEGPSIRRLILGPVTADPTTKAYLQSTLDPIFGYPSLVRFSWSTVKVILEKGGKEVRWCALLALFHSLTSQCDNSSPYPSNGFTRTDQKGGGGKRFFSASLEAIADRERVKLWSEVGLKSLSEL